jgi:hypothetical protein
MRTALDRAARNSVRASRMRTRACSLLAAARASLNSRRDSRPRTEDCRRHTGARANRVRGKGQLREVGGSEDGMGLPAHGARLQEGRSDRGSQGGIQGSRMCCCRTTTVRGTTCSAQWQRHTWMRMQEDFALIKSPRARFMRNAL